MSKAWVKQRGNSWERVDGWRVSWDEDGGEWDIHTPLRGACHTVGEATSLDAALAFPVDFLAKVDQAVQAIRDNMAEEPSQPQAFDAGTMAVTFTPPPPSPPSTWASFFNPFLRP